MVRIRLAVERDAHDVHALLQYLMEGDAAERVEMWREALRDPRYAAWAAEVEGRIVGFLDLLIFPDIAHGRPIGLVNNLVVAPDLRGRGLGERLLRAAVNHCGEQRAVEVHVWTDSDNSPALGLYRKVGFQPRGLLLELPVPGGAPGFR